MWPPVENNEQEWAGSLELQLLNKTKSRLTHFNVTDRQTTEPRHLFQVQMWDQSIQLHKVLLCSFFWGVERSPFVVAACSSFTTSWHVVVMGAPQLTRRACLPSSHSVKCNAVCEAAVCQLSVNQSLTQQGVCVHVRRRAHAVRRDLPLSRVKFSPNEARPNGSAGWCCYYMAHLSRENTFPAVGTRATYSLHIIKVVKIWRLSPHVWAALRLCMANVKWKKKMEQK